MQSSIYLLKCDILPEDACAAGLFQAGDLIGCDAASVWVLRNFQIP